MTALKAVLLDADMTLWRIAHQPAQVWQSVLADLGVEVPPRSGVAALACSRDVLAPGWRALETSGFTNDEAAVRNLWLDVEAAVLHELGITLGLERRGATRPGSSRPACAIGAWPRDERG